MTLIEAMKSGNTFLFRRSSASEFSYWYAYNAEKNRFEEWDDDDLFWHYEGDTTLSPSDILADDWEIIAK